VFAPISAFATLQYSTPITATAAAVAVIPALIDIEIPAIDRYGHPLLMPIFYFRVS
jgi:hypothetical protein